MEAQSRRSAPLSHAQAHGHNHVFLVFDRIFAPFFGAFFDVKQVEMHYNQHGQSQGSALVVMQVTFDV